MNRVKKTNFMRIVSLFAVIFLPIIAVIVVASFIPTQFQSTFLGALSQKYDRIKNIGSPKIVVVGGSSVAFGLRSDLIEEKLDVKAVNFGLYATLGTKVMLELSENYLSEGDIVVLAPELDEQTLSLYFNAETMWQAADSDYSMLKDLDFDDQLALAGAFWQYVGSKAKHMRQGGLNPEGVYNSSSFDEYGDINYERLYNTMLTGYDRNLSIELDPKIFDDAFIEYVNEYIDKVESHGATVYFSFPPMNRLAVSTDATQENIYEFYTFICDNINCEVISNINDYIIDESYFYDSNFHLNDSGVIIRTAQLIEDIRRAKGDPAPVDIKLPEQPKRPELTLDGVGQGSSEGAELFKYGEYDNGLIITGVVDEAKEYRKLTVPLLYEGKVIIGIGEYAFRGCSQLEEIVVHEHVVQFTDGALDGCSSLKKLILQATDANGVSVGGDLFRGAPDSAQIILSKNAYSKFVTDYFWGPYSKRMKIE